MVKWKAVIRDGKFTGQMFMIPDTSMGAKSRGGVDGTAMGAEKAEGLHGWWTDWSAGRLLSSPGRSVTTPSAKVLSECEEAPRSLRQMGVS